MLIFSDDPYQFYEAKPSRVMMWLGRQVNRTISLPGKRHRILDVELRGVEKLVELKRRRDARFLFLPNHSTHSDPQIMTEVLRRLGTPSCFMAAYDVFGRNRLAAWCMQRCGAFSVDRDGGDSRAMKAAIRVLTEGSFALTVFPEGNVHFRNDRVTGFLEGASFIGMKAQRELGDRGVICAVPVSIKATHLHDQSGKVREKIAKLAGDVGTEIDENASFRDELTRIGLAALARNLRQRGIAVPEAEGEPVAGRLNQCADQIVTRLESKMELRARPGAGVPDRVRRIRSQVHQIRIDPEKKGDHQVAAAWADEAILALRLVNYTGDYLAGTPSLDRIAETTEKLLEDYYSEMAPPAGVRQACVRINDPIDLSEQVEAFTRSARSSVRDLTAGFEAAVQSGLDTINVDNPHPGGMKFAE